MKLTVFGSGYVGLVTGACLAEVGNKVMCVDVDPAKIDLLNNGGVPIYEPGLAELVQRNREAGRLLFTTDAAEGVGFGRIQFIAVGTPPDEDGSADLQYVLAVARSIAFLKRAVAISSIVRVILRMLRIDLRRLSSARALAMIHQR